MRTKTFPACHPGVCCVHSTVPNKFVFVVRFAPYWAGGWDLSDTCLLSQGTRMQCNDYTLLFIFELVFFPILLRPRLWCTLFLSSILCPVLWGDKTPPLFPFASSSSSSSSSPILACCMVSLEAIELFSVPLALPTLSFSTFQMSFSARLRTLSLPKKGFRLSFFPGFCLALLSLPDSVPLFKPVHACRFCGLTAERYMSGVVVHYTQMSACLCISLKSQTIEPKELAV